SAKQPAQATQPSGSRTAATAAAQQTAEQPAKPTRSPAGRRATWLSRRGLASQQLFEQIAGVHDVVLRQRGMTASGNDSPPDALRQHRLADVALGRVILQRNFSPAS
ncbi:hypothetical protein QS95_09840, partial [Pseudomonas fluorescens]